MKLYPRGLATVTEHQAIRQERSRGTLDTTQVRYRCTCGHYRSRWQWYAGLAESAWQQHHAATVAQR
mgnify:CR=1 FL=1